MSNRSGSRVEDILFEAGLINEDQLKNAKSLQGITGESIGKILLSEGTTGNKERLISVAKRMGVEFVDLENIKVNKEAVYKLNVEIAKKYLVFPFEIENNMLYLAMRNPDDIFTMDEIKVFTQTEIKPFLADNKLITKAINYFYMNKSEDAFKKEIKQTVKQDDNQDIKRTIQPNNRQDIVKDTKHEAGQLVKREIGQESVGLNIKRGIVEDNKQENKPAIEYELKYEPELDFKRQKEHTDSLIQDIKRTNKQNIKEVVVEVSPDQLEDYIRSIILKAIKLGASDIHIDEYKKNIRVRYRIDGKLSEDTEKTELTADSVNNRIKSMAGLFTCDKNAPQKGRICYEIGRKEKVYIDTLTLPTVSGEKLLLKMENIQCSYTLDNIGLSDYEKNCVDLMFKRKSGMIIVSGLNGSGKSTTACAMIKKVLSDDLNIISIERKVTEKIEGVNQIQLLTSQDDNVNLLIKSVIEHDPDVLLVDVEVDGATIKYLMNAALGGKLIILTLSFPTAYEVLNGLVNMGIESYMVASSVEGIITQNLVRKLCGNCKNKHSHFRESDKNVSVVNRSALSCDVCNNTGYKGKAGVFEVFNMSRDYRKLLSKTTNMGIVEAKMENEKSTFEKNCIRLVNDEVTSVEEIIRTGLGKGIFEN